MQKVKLGKKRTASRLDKFREDICLLRNVHKCSFNQIRDFLLEQKVLVSVTAVANYYNAIAKDNKEKDEVSVTSTVDKNSHETKTSSQNTLADVKKIWEK